MTTRLRLLVIAACVAMCMLFSAPQANAGLAEVWAINEVRDAAKACASELHAILIELRGLRADMKKLSDQLEEEKAWRRLKEAGK